MMDFIEGTYVQQPYQSPCSREALAEGPILHEFAHNGSERFNLRLTATITHCPERPEQRSSVIAPESNSCDFCFGE
jgi:hypothetical protein